jgi:hypothetical protein
MTPAVASCRFDAPADPGAVVFAALVGGRLLFVHGDGSSSVAHAFGGAVADAQAGFGQVSARGDFIAADASWSVHGTLAGEELVLFDRTGRLRWSKTWDAASNRMDHQWYLNDQGTVAIPLLDSSNGTLKDGLVIDATGDEQPFSDAIPIAEATPDGSIPVVYNSPDDTLHQHVKLGWILPGAQSVQPSAYDLFYSVSAYPSVLNKGRLVYIATKDGAPVLVSEQPGDARAFTLPTAMEGYAIVDATQSGWALVVRANGDVSSLLRVDLASGEARSFGLPTSGELRPVFAARGAQQPIDFDLSGATLLPRLDVDGSVLAGLRDDAGGGLYRSSDGSAWARVGESMSKIGDVAHLAHGGTHLLLGVPWQEVSFVPPTESGTPDHVGGALQIVDASGATQVVTEAEPLGFLAPAQLSPDGLCVDYLAVRDGAEVLRAVDVERGRMLDLLPMDLGSASSPLFAPSSIYVTTWVPGRSRD